MNDAQQAGVNDASNPALRLIWYTDPKVGTRLFNPKRDPYASLLLVRLDV
jgi:hypothetical protein